MPQSKKVCFCIVILGFPHILIVSDHIVFHYAKVLAGHRILSAPVVATESNDVEHKETAEPHDSIKDVAGFIDIRDVLSSFLHGTFY